jgi:hypothetical protein
MKNPLAFPNKLENPTDENIVGFHGDVVGPGGMSYYAGMTLRDYFAAAALPGLISNYQYPISHEDDIATAVYAFADAMLETREPKEDK